MGAAALQWQWVGCSRQCKQLAHVQAPVTAAVTCVYMRVTTCISWKWCLSNGIDLEMGMFELY
jgi:hypothetical protein